MNAAELCENFIKLIKATPQENQLRQILNAHGNELSFDCMNALSKHLTELDILEDDSFSKRFEYTLKIKYGMDNAYWKGIE